jgi:hypothetical protein
MKSIKYVLWILIVVSSTELKAQDTIPEKPKKDKIPFRERLFINPDLGLQFGTVTAIDISPKIGYRITDKWAAGLGGTYIYVNDKRYSGYEFKTNIYGGSVFAQYQLLEPVRLYTEYGLLNIESLDPYTFDKVRRIVPSLLAGGGYTQQIGENSSFGIMLLYDLIESPYSIYSNPIIRIGINLGL